MAKLYIMNGPEKGRAFEVRGDTVTIGRSLDNDVQIKDLTVSRNHLKITKKEGKFFIRDLGSANGTYIKGQQIKPEIEVEIKEGLPFAVGRIIINLERAHASELRRWHVMGLKGDALSIHDSVDIPRDVAEYHEGTEPDRPMTSIRNMELLSKASTVLMRSLDIREALEEVLNSIFDLFTRIDRGVFILIDNETGRVSGVVSRSNNREYKTSRSYSRTIVNRVIQEGKAVAMLDTLKGDDINLSESMESMEVRSVMCVPLISKSRIRGVVYVDSLKKPYGFRKDDLSLLTALSSPAAAAIESATFYPHSGEITGNIDN